MTKELDRWNFTSGSVGFPARRLVHSCPGEDLESVWISMSGAAFVTPRRGAEVAVTAEALRCLDSESYGIIQKDYPHRRYRLSLLEKGNITRPAKWQVRVLV